MKCRRIKTYNNVKNIVWFGSYGLNQDGTAKFYDETNIHDNYSTTQQAVVDSLTQRLSIIKNELWYNTSYGIPLIDKYRTKGTIDAYIVTIIYEHPDVVEITSFNSTFIEHSYTTTFTVLTTFGLISIEV